MSEYATRYAPSPTGAMHWGHARIALVAWLRARQAGGRIVMRIEDLDRARVVEGAADAILEMHEWLGFDWDEGPIYQSERVELYEAALARLRRSNLVYDCGCSRKEIVAIASAPHGDLGPIYPGTCRANPPQNQRAVAVRFKMPSPSLPYSDPVMGSVQAGAADGDFILKRADGVFAYQLAVVVDDAESAIAEVVRGADLVSSTPRQIALHCALGYTPPKFLHLPLVLDRAGERLSKRSNAISIAEFRACGWSPQQVVGQLAFDLGLVRSTAAISLEELLNAVSNPIVFRLRNKGDFVPSLLLPLGDSIG
ncbi:MAG: tRNA glutamyl-Q(34) synthetase GluQRS [Polyangiales bacterium]